MTQAPFDSEYRQPPPNLDWNERLLEQIGHFEGVRFGQINPDWIEDPNYLGTKEERDAAFRFFKSQRSHLIRPWLRDSGSLEKFQIVAGQTIFVTHPRQRQYGSFTQPLEGTKLTFDGDVVDVVFLVEERDLPPRKKLPEEWTESDFEFVLAEIVRVLVPNLDNESLQLVVKLWTPAYQETLGKSSATSDRFTKDKLVLQFTQILKGISAQIGITDLQELTNRFAPTHSERSLDVGLQCSLRLAEGRLEKVTIFFNERVLASPKKIDDTDTYIDKEYSVDIHFSDGSVKNIEVPYIPETRGLMNSININEVRIACPKKIE